MEADIETRFASLETLVVKLLNQVNMIARVLAFSHGLDPDKIIAESKPDAPAWGTNAYDGVKRQPQRHAGDFGGQSEGSK